MKRTRVTLNNFKFTFIVKSKSIKIKYNGILVQCEKDECVSQLLQRFTEAFCTDDYGVDNKTLSLLVDCVNGFTLNRIG